MAGGGNSRAPPPLYETLLNMCVESSWYFRAYVHDLNTSQYIPMPCSFSHSLCFFSSSKFSPKLAQFKFSPRYDRYSLVPAVAYVHSLEARVMNLIINSCVGYEYIGSYRNKSWGESWMAS